MDIFNLISTTLLFANLIGLIALATHVNGLIMKLCASQLTTKSNSRDILVLLNDLIDAERDRNFKLTEAIQDVKDAVESGSANQVMDGISNILNYNPFNQRNGGQEGVQR